MDHYSDPAGTESCNMQIAGTSGWSVPISQSQTTVFVGQWMEWASLPPCIGTMIRERTEGRKREKFYIYSDVTHTHVYVMLRCCTFSCTCTHMSCYAAGRSLALPQQTGTTLCLKQTKKKGTFPRSSRDTKLQVGCGKTLDFPILRRAFACKLLQFRTFPPSSCDCLMSWATQPLTGVDTLFLFTVRSPRGRRGVLSFFHVCVIFEASISCHVLQCFLLLRCIFCCFLLCFLWRASCDSCVSACQGLLGGWGGGGGGWGHGVRWGGGWGCVGGGDDKVLVY